jgi:hypothetical protein
MGTESETACIALAQSFLPLPHAVSARTDAITTTKTLAFITASFQGSRKGPTLGGKSAPCGVYCYRSPDS